MFVLTVCCVQYVVIEYNLSLTASIYHTRTEAGGQNGSSGLKKSTSRGFSPSNNITYVYGT